jgi:hypothetical protein
MYLHDHSKVHYRAVRTYIGGAYSVTYGGKLAGHVMRSPSGGWRYLLVGDDSDRDWIAGFTTRKDAADHLLSAFSPSASWLN